jgi:hypothetical protein
MLKARSVGVLVCILSLTIANFLIADTRYWLEGSYATDGNNTDYKQEGNPLPYLLSLYGANLGAEFFSTNLFSLDLGLGYIQRGFYSAANHNGDYTSYPVTTMNYLDFRPSIMYRVPKPRVRPFISMGPYVGELLGGQTTTVFNPGPTLSTPLDSAEVSKYEAGLNATLGLEFMAESKVSLYIRLGYDLPILTFKTYENNGYPGGFMRVAAGLLY